MHEVRKGATVEASPQVLGVPLVNGSAVQSEDLSRVDVSFGPVQLRTEATLDLEIHNGGRADISIEGKQSAFIGVDGFHYALESKTVPADRSVRLFLSFRPEDLGRASAAFQLELRGAVVSSIAFNLDGTGVSP